MFGKEMSKLKFWTTHSIEDKLDIPDYEESTEEDMKKEEKVVTKLITDNMYERTRARWAKNEHNLFPLPMMFCH